MAKEDWFARYRFVSPVGQCGNAVFYLAKDNTDNAFVVVKQFVLRNQNPDDAEDQQAMFEDETRLYSLLHSKGMIHTFDSVSIDGKLFMVIDPQSACDLICAHLKLENIERKISEESHGQ